MRIETPVRDRPWNARGLEACLFDFGGTLDADGVTWQDRFYALYGKHGIDVDREAFRQAFYAADDGLVDGDALAGAGLQETIRAQAERVWEALNLERRDGRLRAVVTDFLDGMRWYTERNRKLLTRLGARYRLGIVSNFYGNLDRVCEDLGIRDLFFCIVDSSRVGMMKPDPGIFRAALDQMGLRPDQSVFVGDNPGRDMEGAKGIGMPHIWLVGEDGRHRNPCCPGDPVIPTLEALAPLLLHGGAENRQEVA